MYVVVTEKNHLICKGHLSYTRDFMTEFQGRTDPAMIIGMHNILCMLSVWLQVHPCLTGNFERLGHLRFPCLCCRCFLFTYIVCTCCKIHSRVPCIHTTHSGACSLFFDVQEVTLLLGKFTLFAHANLCYPTSRLHSYFSTIFAAHLRVYRHTMGCKRSFTSAGSLKA